MTNIRKLDNLATYISERQQELTSILDQIVEIAVSGISVEDNIRERSLLELEYIRIRTKMEHAKKVMENFKATTS
jgi:galactose-1-phosphate uridylyltransferase